MNYESRIIVNEVVTSSQEVVKQDTIKIYDIQQPESIGANNCWSVLLEVKPACATLANLAFKYVVTL